MNNEVYICSVLVIDCWDKSINKIIGVRESLQAAEEVCYKDAKERNQTINTKPIVSTFKNKEVSLCLRYSCEDNSRSDAVIYLIETWSVK